jgi:hypothetical protein
VAEQRHPAAAIAADTDAAIAMQHISEFDSIRFETQRSAQTARFLGGRAKILQQLGRGGMGTAFRAWDTERRMQVALKTLNRLDASGIYPHEERLPLSPVF